MEPAKWSHSKHETCVHIICVSVYSCVTRVHSQTLSLPSIPHSNPVFVRAPTTLTTLIMYIMSVSHYSSNAYVFAHMHYSIYACLFDICVSVYSCVTCVYLSTPPSNRIFIRTPITPTTLIIWSVCHDICVSIYSCVTRVHPSTTLSNREVGGWGRDPKKCTGRDWGMGSSTI